MKKAPRLIIPEPTPRRVIAMAFICAMAFLLGRLLAHVV